MIQLTLVTLNLRVASPSLRAHAQRTVRQRAAFGISGARISIGTRILTLLVDASPIAGTLRVQRALWRDHRLAVAVLERIAHHSDRAGTDGLVALGQTLGRACARVELRARIYARPVAARLGRCAFDVRTASRLDW